MMETSARAAVVLGALVVVAGSCMSHTRIPRADWGGVTADATLRVTTFDGRRQVLTDVAVFPDYLRGTPSLDAATVTGPVRIPLDSIEYLENRSDRRGWAILATIAATATTIAIIDAAGRSDVRPEPTPTSCPFLYSFDGDRWVFDSETYAGAVTAGLKRTDLDNLDHLRPVDGRYRLLLTNERPETEYTDELTLVVVDHPPSARPFPDARGDARLLADARAPNSATGLHGGDALSTLLARDGHAWTGAPVAQADLSVDAELRDGLILSFARPASNTALLAVHARNTELAPLALQMFLELQGDDLVPWYRRVDREPETAASLREWVLREGTLHVSVWRDGHWHLQDALLDVGPLLPKTQVALLDLSEVEGGEVRVKLESARGLWTIDQVALGVQSEGESRVTRLVPIVARHRDGRDLVDVLMSADGRHHTALEGDSVNLEFEVPPPPPPGWTRTVMVRSTGFYHIRTRSEGPARPAIADRILSEPLFGNRFLLNRLRATGPEAAAAAR